MSAVWITSALLLFVFPSAAMAAEAAGLVRVSGNATIDGRPCQSVEVWFTGEKLVTGSGSNAVVTAPGTVVSLASNTIVKLRGQIQRTDRGPGGRKLRGRQHHAS